MCLEPLKRGWKKKIYKGDFGHPNVHPLIFVKKLTILFNLFNIIQSYIFGIYLMELLSTSLTHFSKMTLVAFTFLPFLRFFN